jgi:hypothetical protein
MGFFHRFAKLSGEQDPLALLVAHALAADAAAAAETDRAVGGGPLRPAALVGVAFVNLYTYKRTIAYMYIQWYIHM